MSELTQKPSEQNEFFEDDGQMMEDLANLNKLQSDFNAVSERMRRVSAFIENVNNGLPAGKRIVTYTDGIATEILSRDESGNYNGQSTLYGSDRLLPFLGDGIQRREANDKNELIVTNSELGLAIPVSSVAGIIDISEGFSADDYDTDDPNIEYEADVFEVFASYSPKLRTLVKLGEKSIFADMLL